MLVAEIMTPAAVTTRPETRAKDALRKLSDRAITSLPVVDEDNRLVGIVSETDLLRQSVAAEPHAARAVERRLPRSVKDVMARFVVTAAPNQDIAAVVDVMLERGIHSVPVLAGGRVIGMLSRSDIVRALAHADEWIADDVTARLRDTGLRGWRCDVDNGHVRLAGGPAFDTRLATSLASCVAGVRSVAVEPVGGLD
jgi:CBS-domain-containing membrane protein